MFGGYTEVFAFGQDIEKDDIQTLDTPTSSEISNCSIASGKSQLFGGFKTWPDLRKDFIILAECSEIYGPVPILTIPKNIDNIDLNAFTVQILSADYQGLGSNERIPTKDTQLLKPDALKDTHTLINYFVLLDSQARGFVRPVCIAYVTSDKYKLIHNAHLLQNALIQASTALKQSNMKLFLYELNNLLEDLEYTKTEFIKELPCESSCMKLELLESTQREVLQAYNNIYHLKVDEEIEKVGQTFLSHLKSLPENICQDLNGIILNSSRTEKMHEPSVKKLPLHRNFDSKLRPYPEICCSGFILGIYQLYIIYKFFRRKHENIIIGLKEKEFRGSVLRFGACLRISDLDLERYHRKSLGLSHNCSLIMPNVPLSCGITEDNFSHLSTDFFDLFSNMNRGMLKNSSSNRSLTSSSEEMEITSSKRNSDHKEIQFFLKMNNQKNKKVVDGTTYFCPWHGLSLGNMWDVIEEYQSDGSEKCFHEMLQKLYFTQHILYSILIGRPIALVGRNHPDSEFQIRILVKCLGLLVPRTRRKTLWIELWKTTLLTEEDLDSLAVIGLGCAVGRDTDTIIPSSLIGNLTVIDMNCFSFTGPYYSGCLLENVDTKLKCLPPDGPIFSVLISILADIEMKVQFWQSNARTLGNTTSASDHFLNKGFTKHDFHIIQKLGECMEDT